MHKFILFGLLAGLWLQVDSQGLKDLCGLASCNNREHLMCLFQTSDWGPECDKRVSYNMLNLATFTTQITDYINTFRNSMAGGNEPGFATAANMGTLEWNNGMANIARYNVRQCESRLDQCRNNADFNYCGETVGWSTFVAATDKRTNADVIIDIIDYWISQKQFSSAEVMAAYTPGKGTTRNDAFTQLSRDAMNRIGCAAVAMDRDGTLRTILFSCIFNTGIFNGKPVYKTGKAVSGCKAGKNPKFTNLCATTEVFDVNDPEKYF